MVTVTDISTVRSSACVLLDNGESVPISAANLSRSKTALMEWRSGLG